VALAWYLLLGLFFATYLALAGYDYGVGVLLARPATERGRRVALNALGPFFLGNEVWLVATAGLLFGAFPALEGALLAGPYPAVAAGVAGAVLVVVSVQLRSRPAPAARARWDRLVTAGSVLAAAGWGAVLGGLLQGVPPQGRPATDALTPFTAACALALVALVTTHGAAFLALRLPAEPARRHAGLVTRLAPVAAAAVGAAAVLGVTSPAVRATASRPGAALAVLGLLLGALALARVAAGRGRAGWAFAATAASLALPVLLVGAATYPYAVGSPGGDGLAVADAAAAPQTLRLLGWVVWPTVPALLAVQAAGWWLFRGRVDRSAPTFY
jgi:cytochrome d ubiquinol oxidase subunit II